MRYFIFFILLFTYSNGTDLAKKYFIEKDKNLTIQEVIQNKNIFLDIKKYGLGIQKNNIWVHIPLKNSSKKSFKKRIYNKRAGLDFVDAFIVKNDKVISSYKLGDMREYEQRDNLFRVSYFDVEVQAFENIDIFIKQKAYSSTDIKWHITDIKSFTNYYDKQSIIYAFIAGLLCVTVIISLILFFFLKNKFYLIYASFSFSVIIYQLCLAGYFYQFKFPLWSITLINFPFPMMVLIILGLFPIYFFDLKKNEFKITLNVLKTLMFIDFILSFIEFFYILNPDILYLTKYTTYLSLSFIITLFILSIKTFIAKKRGSLFYLLANTVQFSFITIYLLMLIGIIKHTDLYYYSLSVGSLGQDILLAIALIHSTYLIKKEHDKNQELLNEYSKLSFVGQTMLNISHQWKAPINNIYNFINHIKIAQEFKDPKINEIVNTNIENIKETTNYLKDTALNQLDFYKEKSHKEKINLFDELNYVIKLISSEFTKKSIDIKLECKESLIFEIEKNYFLNILMILFENSFKIFEQKKIKNPTILLKVSLVKDKLNIKYQDNAKGTSEKNLSRIFEKDYSESNSTGIGLYLANEIVKYKLKGKISAKNIKDGILFEITI